REEAGPRAAAVAESVGCRRSVPASRGIDDGHRRKKVRCCRVSVEWKEETRLWVQRCRERGKERSTEEKNKRGSSNSKTRVSCDNKK
ncbi:hypothetical protein BHE74_00004438, partial [Ensete ventricosum]